VSALILRTCRKRSLGTRLFDLTREVPALTRSPAWEAVVLDVHGDAGAPVDIHTNCKTTKASSIHHLKRGLEVWGVQDWTYPCLVHWVERAAATASVLRVAIGSRPMITNFESRGVTEGGRVGREHYRAAGLTGAGQIVGVADTGLDDLSCFFVDDSEAYATPYTNRSGVVEPLRRKVIQYFSSADNSDYFGGHGSHVTGSIAGASISDFGNMDGMAPGAKVAFFDIGTPGTNMLMMWSSQYDVQILYCVGLKESLYVPDLNEVVFPTAYKVSSSQIFIIRCFGLTVLIYAAFKL